MMVFKTYSIMSKHLLHEYTSNYLYGFFQKEYTLTFLLFKSVHFRYIMAVLMPCAKIFNTKHIKKLRKVRSHF